MIDLLRVVNFKLFSDLSIPFSRLTILAGGNGTGKSSVVQSLLLSKRAFELNSINKSEVELNGPFHLELGKATGVISGQASSDQIEFNIRNSRGLEDQVIFGLEPDISPSALQLLEASDGSGAFPGSFRYLNAERIGPRTAQNMNATRDLNVGSQGEFTSYVLHQGDVMRVAVHESLRHQDIPIHHFSAHVEFWLRTIIPDIQLSVNADADYNRASVKFRTSLESEFHIAPATGFGISYVLPVVVAGLLASNEPEPLFIVENPEAHLHPYGQSRIGRFLALLAFFGVQVIVETHSEHVINGARLQMTECNATEQLLIHFFSNEVGETKVKNIRLNSIGELTSWPVGFFDQQQQDLRELLRYKIR